MADIVDFPQSENQQARQLQNWVAEVIGQHPDENVAQRWSVMASATCQQFSSAPWPTQETLPLDVLQTLDDDTREAVLNALQEFMQSYFNDVNTQLLAVHREILTLQKQIAEQHEGYNPTT